MKKRILILHSFHWVLGVKLQEHEANHSPQTSAEVKKKVDLYKYIHSPIRPYGVVLS
jgi:hypothetical protein